MFRGLVGWGVGTSSWRQGGEKEVCDVEQSEGEAGGGNKIWTVKKKKNRQKKKLIVYTHESVSNSVFKFKHVSIKHSQANWGEFSEMTELP